MHVLTAASVCRRPNALVGLRHRLPHSRVAAGVGDSGSAVGTHTQRLSMGGGRAQTQDGALQSLGGCLRPSFHPTLCKSPAPAAGCAGYPHALPRQQRNIVGGRRLQTSAGPAAASSRSHSGVVHRGVLAARRPAPRGSTACLEPFTAPHRCTSTDSVAQSRPKLPDRYDPAQVESDARYTEWQSSFAPLENNVSASERFTMMLPPPNVTGALHLGHALTIAIEDTVARWHRAKGTSVLWLPGSDHAGIATQTVVEKQLLRTTGQSRHDVGRKVFVDAVWKWKNEKGSAILQQVEALGASLDWGRNVFTLDKGYSRAVTEAFVQLHDRGLIYRSERVVNWSPTLGSALSDIEVEKMTLDGPTTVSVAGYGDSITFGQIYRIAYPARLSTGADAGCVEVATTRPETMLGDVAVAVHPDDPRYTHLHGGSVVNPLTNQSIPVVLDATLVDPALGTGVVKITPAHDVNDHAAGKRHNLPSIAVIDTAGKMCWPEGTGKQYHGLPRFLARAAMLTELKESGALRAVDDHPMILPLCSRSGDVIEPMLSPQWFVDCEDMANRALGVVDEGEITILPQQYVSTWRDWLENIQDWCISRQLWWGHQIPAYRATVAGDSSDSATETQWVVGRTEAEARDRAADKLGIAPDQVVLTQDEDVLDTWFASALFPFASLGWPEKTPDLTRHFPGSLLETGHDILFFWVARMVMMSLELTGQIPFRQVYLHAMIRDAKGKKMSKSVGNVIDPNDVIRGVTIDELVQRITDSGTIDKAEVKRAVGLQRKQFPQGIPACGADALRFSLLSYTSHARDIKFDVEKVVGHRAFLNKVWNATRFVLHATADGSSAATVATLPPLTGLASAWIISRLASTVVQANAALEAFNFAQYTAVLQHFWITDFCDTYIELAKNDLRDPAMAPEARVVLLTCLQVGTELLAPATPFIAAAILEVLPHHVDGSQGLPASHTFPEPAEWEPLQSAATEVRMADVLLIAKAIRAVPLRQIDPQVKLNAYAVGETPASHALLQEGEATIRHLSRASSFTVLREGESLPSGSWVVPTQAGHPCAVAVTTATPLDPKAIQAELARLGASKHNLLGSRDKVVGRMQGGGYARAPEAVKERDAQTVVQLERQAEEIGALEAVYRGWLGTP